MSLNYKMVRCAVILLLAVYWPGIALGTHLPEKDLGFVADLPYDKFAHVGSYAGLTFLLTWAVMWAHPSFRRTVAVLGIIVVYGLVDELTQMLVPTRSAELLDFLADCVGGLAGLAVYFVTWRLVRHLIPDESKSEGTLQSAPET